MALVHLYTVKWDFLLPSSLRQQLCRSEVDSIPRSLRDELRERKSDQVWQLCSNFHCVQRSKTKLVLALLAHGDAGEGAASILYYRYNLLPGFFDCYDHPTGWASESKGRPILAGQCRGHKDRPWAWGWHLQSNQMILLLRWLVMSRSTMSPPHFKVPTSSGESTNWLDDVELSKEQVYKIRSLQT